MQLRKYEWPLNEDFSFIAVKFSLYLSPQNVSVIQTLRKKMKRMEEYHDVSKLYHDDSRNPIHSGT